MKKENDLLHIKISCSVIEIAISCVVKHVKLNNSPFLYDIITWRGHGIMCHHITGKLLH